MAVPTLLYLHGIGSGDPERSWLAPLESALPRLGFPGLEGVEVLAPNYSGLMRSQAKGVAEALRDVMPDDKQRDAVFDYERRMARLEELLGGSAHGKYGVPPASVATTALRLARHNVRQAAAYAQDTTVRGRVLSHVQRALLNTDEVVILAHSLGSVVARDLLLRLPERLRVRGVITIGIPLPHEAFAAPRDLGRRFPYHLVDSWVNVWNTNDPVSYGRGIAFRYPMAFDKGIDVALLGSHYARNFTKSEPVVLAIGDALFGSRNRSVALVEKSLSPTVQQHELQLMLRLTHGHLLAERSSAKVRPRATAAMRLVQEGMLEQLVTHYSLHRLAVPAPLADARDGSRPHPLPRISRQESVVALLLLASANAFEPFEISVGAHVRREALGDLAVAIGQTRDFGLGLFDCLGEAREAVKASKGNWQRYALGAAGIAILVGGPVAWSMAAAPVSVAGGAAIVSTLAAFGPGGMVGGLMTIGTLASVGTGATVTALLSGSVESVEASVAQLLAAAIAADRFGLEGAGGVWSTLCEMEAELTATIAHRMPYSDSGAASIGALEEKRSAVQRAIQHLVDRGLVETLASTTTATEADLGPEAADSLLEMGAAAELNELEAGRP